jgi:single-stranded-DNA-specific exonuclease
METIIQRRPTPASIPPSLSHLPPVLASALANRGLTDDLDLDMSAGHLLKPDLLPDIDVAAEIIAQAVMRDASILIVGDFDADGATATAVAVKALRAFGSLQVEFVLPDRQKHGYGLSPHLIDDWIYSSHGRVAPELIITVDNGVSAHAGVIHAQGLGAKVVVTDHHLPGDTLPPADALVNPNLKGSEFESPSMAGVGVSFYVMAAVRSALTRAGWFNASRPAPNLATLLDLVAVGTVADVVHLDANNRRLVSLGLDRIRSPNCNMGVASIFAVAGKDYRLARSTDLGFLVGPRLNAAGRLENMRIGVECLVATDPADARRCAVELDRINGERKFVEQTMLSTVGEASGIDSVADLPRPDSPKDWALFRPEFHQGVIGIVAGRLKERWLRPVFVFAASNPDEVGMPGSVLKGSGRSIPGVHLRDVLVEIATADPDLLIGFGGHAMAAGLSILEENFHRFQSLFAQAVVRHKQAFPDRAEILSDGELAPDDLSLDFAEAVQGVVPWGTGCPEPVFDNMFEVVEKKSLSDGQHWKLTVRPLVPKGSSCKPSSATVEAVWFGIGEKLPLSKYLRLAYRLDVNRFRGESKLQLMVVAGMPS